MKIKVIVACLLLTGFAYAQDTPPAPKSAPTRIFAGAKIFIETEGAFAMALGASFIEKKVPVTVVAQPEKADFILKAASEDRKASTAAKIFGVGQDRYHGTVSVFNKEDVLVFA